MGFCTGCGHEFGLDRFCTNCGRATTGDLAADAGGPPYDDPRTDTAERPAVRLRPEVPIPLPSPPRFPLFADEVTTAPRPAPPPPDVLPTGFHEGGGWTSRTPPPPPSRHRGGWFPFAVLGVVLLLVLSVGVWLLVRDGRGAGSALDSPPVAGTAGDPSGPPPSGTDVERDPTAPVTAPKETSDLARSATARVPRTAPPNQSLGGATVHYRAGNMLDGRPETAWRMPGDGTGQMLRFELGEEAVITRVGLVNGYAKTDTAENGRPVRWYRHNRRVEQVTWIFDDGTEVVQHLRTTQRMQRIDVDPVRSSTVRLRLDTVSAPGDTKRARDFTPISEVTLVGGAPAD